MRLYPSAWPEQDEIAAVVADYTPDTVRHVVRGHPSYFGLGAEQPHVGCNLLPTADPRRGRARPIKPAPRAPSLLDVFNYPPVRLEVVLFIPAAAAAAAVPVQDLTDDELAKYCARLGVAICAAPQCGRIAFLPARFCSSHNLG